RVGPRSRRLPQGAGPRAWRGAWTCRAQADFFFDFDFEGVVLPGWPGRSNTAPAESSGISHKACFVAFRALMMRADRVSVNARRVMCQIGFDAIREAVRFVLRPHLCDRRELLAEQVQAVGRGRSELGR